MGLPIAWSGALAVTMEGARYVDENERMRKVRDFLGKAFPMIPSAAVEATRAM